MVFSIRKSSKRDDDDEIDKQWAQKYINDPLTAPEPSQETGLGSSHYATLQRRPSAQRSTSSTSRPLRPESRQSPTSPQSISSPARSDFHPSNPFADPSGSASHKSKASIHQESVLVDVSPPASPQSSRKRRQGPPLAFYNSSVNRSASVNTSSQPVGDHRRHRSLDSQSVQPPAGHTRSRSQSLLQRYPGDMSHRPLDIIKRETRAADKPHRHRARGSRTDIIDNLDTIGGTYHHEGPYEATLASRNVNKKYSPVAAVEDSNNEALRATPRAYIQDSLQRHVPLQGTAIHPPGETDPLGNVLDYEEGADLMREPDAAGGAYKRWDHIPYHPEDLKGKGEPSYTFERDTKLKGHAPEEYELRSGVNGYNRPRRHSNIGQGTAREEYSVRRSNTTGKKLSEGLKRRFGSMRKSRSQVGTQRVD